MTVRVARGDPEVAAPDGRTLRLLAGRTAFTGPASVRCGAATRTWTGWPVRWRYWREWRR